METIVNSIFAKRKHFFFYKKEEKKREPHSLLTKTSVKRITIMINITI
uniref:Uncharacterized protein n=1 Tax=Anguilla anguilla TaxID=7936 RepID=A0A0E9WVV7_ANGAN